MQLQAGAPVCAYDGRARGMYTCTAKGSLPPANNQDGLIAYCDCKPDGCPCDTEGSRSCLMRGLSICKNGYWTEDTSKVCNKSQVCSETAGGVCIPWNLCNKDEMICDGDRLMTCADGFFQLTEDCQETKSYCITSYIKGERTASCVQKPINAQTCHTGDPWTFDMSGKPKSTTCSDSERCILTEESTSLPEVNNIVAKCTKTVCVDHTFTCDKNGNLSVCRDNEYRNVANCNDYGLTCDSKAGKCIKK